MTDYTNDVIAKNLHFTYGDAGRELTEDSNYTGTSDTQQDYVTRIPAWESKASSWAGAQDE